MTQVKLMGELGTKFGTDWTSGQKSMREILKLIDCQVEGFKEYLAECQDKNIQFTVQNGEDFMEDSLDELTLNNLKDTVIITPVPAGSGKGLGKLIAGLLLLTAMFFMPGTATMFTNATAQSSMMVGGQFMASGSASLAQAIAAGTFMPAAGTAAAVTLTNAGMAVAMLGVNLAMMGLTQMSMPDAGSMESDPSFLFNGADNNIEQGQPVPLLYGTMKIGGTALSQGFKAGELRNTTYNVASATATSYSYTGTGSYTRAGGNNGNDGQGAVSRR